MRILGIDPGLAIVGYAILDCQSNDRFELISSGSIQTMQQDCESKRLLEIFEDLDSLMKKYKPDVVGIEKLFYFKNQKTVMAVSQARGVILAAIEKNKVPIFEYTPIEIKQTITGFGRAQKEEVKKFVNLSIELADIKLDDTIDAIAIAICHARNIIF